MTVNTQEFGTIKIASRWNFTLSVASRLRYCVIFPKFFTRPPLFESAETRRRPQSALFPFSPNVKTLLSTSVLRLDYTNFDRVSISGCLFQLVTER